LGVAFAISRAPLPDGSTGWTRPLLGPNQPLARLALAHDPTRGDALARTTAANAPVPLAASGGSSWAPSARDADVASSAVAASAGRPTPGDASTQIEPSSLGSGTSEVEQSTSAGAGTAGQSVTGDASAQAAQPAGAAAAPVEVSTYSVQPG